MSYGQCFGFLMICKIPMNRRSEQLKRICDPIQFLLATINFKFKSHVGDKLLLVSNNSTWTIGQISM